jgi:hypothetical protein
MIYERFRAGETTAKPAWNDGASGPLRRGPATGLRLATDTTGRSCPPSSGGHDPAEQVILGWSIHGPAGVLRFPSTSLLRATPAPHLLYRPQPRQICQTGKVPAYGTLPPVHLCVGTNVYFQPREFRHSLPNRR